MNILYRNILYKSSVYEKNNVYLHYNY